jgi:adenylate cyclase
LQSAARCSIILSCDRYRTQQSEKVRSEIAGVMVSMASVRDKGSITYETRSDISSSARRWAAIVMMDVVGFTSLTERDEAGTLRRWESWWTTCIEPSIKRHQGHVFRRLGDGMLVEFPVADEALACVLEIQHEFASQAHQLPAFRLRCAVNAGEVETWNGDLHGNAVNITARLQEFAAPGGVIVSETIEELVRDRIAEPMDELGDVELKGIERRVRAFSLLESPSWFLAGGRPSIAVLPFAEIDSHEGGYFGDGIVENIVNALAALRELFVVSRSSTLAFRAGAADLRQVQKDLGVRYVLSGSVRRAQDRIRIAAELSDTESQSVLWSDRIDGRLDDIFDFQDSVAQQIVGIIAPHVREAEIRRVIRKRPESLNAYDCFLRGLDLVYRLKREQFDGALPMFARAIKLDPQYAAPYAYSALWHAIRIGQGWTTDLAADKQAVEYFAEAAVDRDRLDASSLALCGHVKSLQFKQYEAAFELFDRATAASPNSAVAWTRSSATYSYVGDWKEGRRRAQLGLQLSPLDRHLFYSYTVLTLAAYTGQEYDDAIDWGRKAMSENPDFTANLRLLCAALSAAGRIDEARQVAHKLLGAEPTFRVKRFCANYAYKDPKRLKRLAAHLLAAGLPN